MAFTSTRTGNGDIYVLSLANGELARLTFDDAEELVTAWSADGDVDLLLLDEPRNLRDGRRVPCRGRQAARRCRWPRIATRPSTSRRRRPTGGAIAITARANAGSQWWRKGHSHLDESEIWIVKDAATPSYQPVTKGGAKDAWPMWSADGKTLYFMSDRSGAQNIWSAVGVGADVQDD